MNFVALFFVLTLSAFANNFETFFAGIEGEWKLEREFTEVTLPTGEVSSSSTITRFDATITRESYGWSLWEEYCVIENGDEVCGDMWAIYQVVDGKLILVTESGKDEVKVLELTSTLLLFELGQAKSHTESLSHDSVLQKNMASDSDGTLFVQSLYLKRAQH